MKYALGVAAALALSAAFAPAASAEPDFATVALTPVEGWYGPQTWTTRPGYTQEFAVDITNVAGHDEQGLDVFISFPTDRLEVTGHEGEDWNCWDVNGGVGAEGIKCTQNHLIVHEEAWPTLKVRTKVLKSEYHLDSIDVYADAGGHDTVHRGQQFLIDTST